MYRTTILLDSDLEIGLRLSAQRLGKPMSEIIREALRSHLDGLERPLPPGVAGFDSGHSDTADRAEELLRETGFGDGSD